MKKLTRPLHTSLLALAVLAAILLDGGLWGPGFGRKAGRFSQWPMDVPAQAFTDWQERDPEESLNSLDMQLTQLVQAARDRAGARELLSRMSEAEQTFAQIQTDQAFAQWASSRDVERFGAQHAAWNNAANRAYGLYAQTRQELLEADPGPEVRAYLGDEGDEQVPPAYTQEQLDMLDRETELVHTYQRLLGTREERCTVTDGGVTYQESSLLAAYLDGSLSEADYQRLQETLSAAANAELGSVYLELVKLRNEFARSLGYENYAAYAYPNLYGRDYTPEEALRFCRTAMEQMAPLVASWKEAGNHPELDAAGVDGLLYGRTEQELVDMVQPYLGKVSPELADVFAYMLDNGLLDAEALDSKAREAYTIDLPVYQSALVYLSPDDLNLFTLVHEFGHFADTCLAPNLASCVDSAEIASQGLETLYLSFAQELVGPDYAAALRWTEVYNLLWAIMDAARLGAFELKAYTDPDITLDRLNGYYHELCVQSGAVSASAQTTYGWELVPHLFGSPCYYVSYGTSAANALELLLRSWKDFDQGAERYLDLVAQTDTQGYVGAVEAAGLLNMLEPESLTELTRGLKEYLDQEICQAVPVSGASRGHWTEKTGTLQVSPFSLLWRSVYAGQSLTPATA